MTSTYPLEEVFRYPKDLPLLVVKNTESLINFTVLNGWSIRDRDSVPFV